MNLNGKKVLITRPKAQTNGFVESLVRLGAQPVCFPVIQIVPIPNNDILDQALANLERYDWLVLTSANAVKVVWGQIAALNITALPKTLRIATIGPKTAVALERVGISPDFVPEEYVAEAILPGLGDLEGRWVLLPRADIARQTLPEAITQAGGIAHEIAVYRTVPPEPDAAGLQALQIGVDVVTFTSSSTVRNFYKMTNSAGLDPLHLPGNPIYACIGPITASTARDLGFPVNLVASEYTVDGLIGALNSFYE